MKLIATFLLALVSATFAADCNPGYFRKTDDENCNYACSEGCKGEGNLCESTGGKCLEGCNTELWENSDTCDVPKCFGSAGCSEGGKCVAPNTCICGESGAQVVAKKVDVDGVEGTDCVSLRKDGIMGAGIALIVMLVSISICGGIAEKNGKAK